MKWKWQNHQYNLSFTDKELDEIKEGTVYTTYTKSNELIVIRRMEDV